MEPSATLAQWDGDTLTVIDATQGCTAWGPCWRRCSSWPPSRSGCARRTPAAGSAARARVAPPDHRAGRRAGHGRRSRIVLARAQMYSVIAYQPAERADRRARRDDDGAADRDRPRVDQRHPVSDDFVEFATEASERTSRRPRSGCPSASSASNVNLPDPMRRPVEGCGTWALGQRDERAGRRSRDRPARAPADQPRRQPPGTGQPWSSKKLREGATQRRELARSAGAGGRASRARRRLAGGAGDGRLRDGAFRNPVDAGVRLHADGSARDRGGHSGHRHRNADDLPSDRRRRARAGAGDGQL